MYEESVQYKTNTIKHITARQGDESRQGYFSSTLPIRSTFPSEFHLTFSSVSNFPYLNQLPSSVLFQFRKSQPHKKTRFSILRRVS